MTIARYNPPQRMSLRSLCFLAAALLIAAVPVRASGVDQPAADLARQIAAVAGPGPAKLVVLNNSSLPISEVSMIRQELERDLRSFGVLPNGPNNSTDSGTVIHVTLSQNLREGLWVAEIREGTEVRVAMVPAPLDTPPSGNAGPMLTLRRTLLLSEPDNILDAAVFTSSGEQRLVVLEPERVLVFTRNTTALMGPGAAPAWSEPQTFPIRHARPYSRDLRGRIIASQDHWFDAYLPGVLCSASNAGAQLTMNCDDSDDPWPVTPTRRAFYNGMRDNFTGVLAPGFGMQIPPFYSAADLPRIGGAATLLNEVNGKVLVIENGVLKPIAGTNDWGSDFTVVRSGCGSGAQALVSGSGAAAAGDSLRAFEIAGREAIQVSASLPVKGAIESISAAADGTSATVIVRRDSPAAYEVWNVAAICN